MIEYFIYLSKDNQTETSDAHLLGTNNGFGSFWSGKGLIALNKIVNENPEMLENVIIKTSKGETISVSRFIKEIEPLKLITH